LYVVTVRNLEYGRLFLMNMDRPTFHEIYMNFALDLARRSSCERLKVGCVIVKADYTQVLSIGYNGNAHGLPNKCDSVQPGYCGCIHAETNALIKCYSPSNVKKIVYLTHSPCKMCAKNMIQLGGIKLIVYNQDYRSDEGLQILRNDGIQIHKWRIDDSES
jgi:dCMP deaminase